METTKREAMEFLHKHRECLTMREYSTIRGQIREGDSKGAIKGLYKVMKRRKDYEPRRA